MEKSRRRMYSSQSKSLESKVKELEAQLEKAEAVIEKAEAVIEYYVTELKDGIFRNTTPSALSNKAVNYFEDKKEIL